MTKAMTSHGDPLCHCGTRLGTSGRRESGHCKRCEIRCRPLFIHCRHPGCLSLVPVSRDPRSQWVICEKCRRARCVVCGRRFRRRTPRNTICGRAACRRRNRTAVEKLRVSRIPQKQARKAARAEYLLVQVRCGKCGVWFCYKCTLDSSGFYPRTRSCCDRCVHAPSRGVRKIRAVEVQR